MLEALRRGTGSWVVKTLLALLIVSFAAWGIGDIFRGGGDTTVAKVGNINITANQFSQAFQRQLQRFQESGSPITSAEARAFGLDRQVLSSLITRILMDLHTQDLGLSISEQRFGDEVRKNPVFRDSFGKYDRYRLKQVLAAAGMSEKQFVTSVESDLRKAQLINLIELVDLVPNALVEKLYRYKNEHRVARLVILPYEGIKAGLPTEDTLTKFHVEKAAEFTAPEYRTISYLSLSPQDLMDEVQVNEDDLRAEYENRHAEFVVPEKRSVDQILVSDEKTAQSAYQRLQEGADFAQVAKDIADLSVSDSDLGILSSADFFTEPLAAAAFSLSEGGTSAPVQTELGWHLLRVRNITLGNVRTFDEVISELTVQLRLSLATDALYDFANRVDDELGGGATLEEMSQSMPLKFATLGPIDSTGRNQAGVKDEALPSESEFITSAFKTEEGMDSGLVETADGKYYVLRIDTVLPSALRPLESVREALVSLWQQIERARIVRGNADTLMAEAKEIDALVRRAKELGYRVRYTPQMLRDGQDIDKALTTAQLSTLFTLNPGDMTSGPTPSEKSYVIAALEEIIPANPAMDPEGISKMRISIADEMPGDLLAQYQTGLENDTGVTVYPIALDNFFGDMP